MAAQPVNFEEREAIVNAIKEIKVGSGQSLRQVQVPDETYNKARKFVLRAPNIIQQGSPFRFKILWNMPSGRSIYALLAADADCTSLAEADAKVTEWIDASKSLLRYALNLILAPKRPEFQRLKLSNSYFVYQVAKKLKDAQEILHAMGYEGTQELKYKGDVDSVRVTETAADLVILVGELERVKSLVQHATIERIPVVLSDVLQARSHPMALYGDAKYTLDNIAASSTASPRRYPPTVHGQPPQPTPTPQQYAPAQRNTPMQRSEQPQGQQRLSVANQHLQGSPQRAHAQPNNQRSYDDRSTEQSHSPQSNIRRGSAPVLQPRGHHEHQQPVHTNAKHRAHYQNLPLFPEAMQEIRERQGAKEHEQCHHQPAPNDPGYANLQETFMPADTHPSGNPTLVPQSQQQGYGAPEEPLYANVGRRSAQRGGAYEQVDPPTSRGPVAPPNPMDLPEPIVQNALELEKMNVLASDAPFDPDSIVNARSDAVAQSGPYMDSLMSYQPPEQPSIFDRQAEDAWRVDTPRADSKQPGQNVFNALFVPQAPTDTVECSNNDAAANNLVTQEWLDENRSDPDPDYENWQQPAAAKDLKKYDKPAPDLKHKLFSERMANQKSMSDLSSQEHGSYTHPSQPTSQGSSSNNSFDNASQRKPKPTPRAKSSPQTSRTCEDDIVIPPKSYTSPQSSLESDKQPSIGNPSLEDNHRTLVEIEDGDMVHVHYIPSTDKSHTSSTLPSLSPQTRRRADAINSQTSSPTCIMRRKAAGAVKSSRQGASATVKDEQTDKYIKSMSSGPLSKVDDEQTSQHTTRDRPTHTDLDTNPAKRAQYRAAKKPATVDLSSNARLGLPPALPANAGEQWTCGYCYNMVFDPMQDVCDVCSAEKPADAGTLV